MTQNPPGGPPGGSREVATDRGLKALMATVILGSSSTRYTTRPLSVHLVFVDMYVYTAAVHHFGWYTLDSLVSPSLPFPFSAFSPRLSSFSLSSLPSPPLLLPSLLPSILPFSHAICTLLSSVLHNISLVSPSLQPSPCSLSSLPSPPLLPHLSSPSSSILSCNLYTLSPVFHMVFVHVVCVQM